MKGCGRGGSAGFGMEFRVRDSVFDDFRGTWGDILLNREPRGWDSGRTSSGCWWTTCPPGDNTSRNLSLAAKKLCFCGSVRL